VLTILALFLAARPGDLGRPLDLYELTVADAQKLHGQRVEVFVEVGSPVDVGDGFTVAAAYERPDRVERHVYLTGERHGIAVGDVLIVSGTLRVIRHADATVNGVFVPGWTEIRVEEVRVWRGGGADPVSSTTPVRGPTGELCGDTPRAVSRARQWMTCCAPSAGPPPRCCFIPAR
jgi:hypothetical protein